MKALYIIGIIVLMAALAISIQAHLIWPSIALGVALLWVCVSLYGRIDRLLYAYHETEKENGKLHTRLAESERQLQYLRQLTENVDTALFVCSTDGRIDWMNHAGAPLLSPQGGRNFLPQNILQAIVEHQEVVDGCALSTTLLTIDGRRRLIVALKDVSQLMQRQEMEAWQQLIRVLTHEIMNSLTPIISISETLTDENEAFAVINRRCHSLLDFVESYRQLTRIKAPERTTFPVSDLFEHITGLYPQVKTQGEGQLTADRSQIEQVLINLVKNAYESGATEVEVAANPQPCPIGGEQHQSDSPSLREGLGVGCIRVKDNGCGMSPNVLEHAFIPFFTTKPTGTGIGLALCRQIILKHGGTISVESIPEKGTTFTIKL